MPIQSLHSAPSCSEPAQLALRWVTSIFSGNRAPNLFLGSVMLKWFNFFPEVLIAHDLGWTGKILDSRISEKRLPELGGLWSLLSSESQTELQNLKRAGGQQLLLAFQGSLAAWWLRQILGKQVKQTLSLLRRTGECECPSVFSGYHKRVWQGHHDVVALLQPS